MRILSLPVAVLALLEMAFLAVPQGVSYAGEGPGTVEWFPRERLFPKLLADGTAQQMSLNKDMQTRRWIGSIGGIQRVGEWRSDSLKVQFGVGATVDASLIRKPAILQVVTADFFVDFPIEIQFSQRFLLRTGWGHHSAHLVDDGIEILNLHSINYAKDYVPLLAGVNIPELRAFAYVGTRIDYYTIPERSSHWVLQAGMQGGWIAIASGADAYAALDIKVKSEAGWGTTQSYQVGIRTLRSGESALRISYTYRTGLDDRGQFYRQHIAVSLLGVYFDF